MILTEMQLLAINANLCKYNLSCNTFKKYIGCHKKGSVQSGHKKSRISAARSSATQGS